MDIQDLILIDTLCTHYEVEYTFFDQLDHFGLLHIERVDQDRFVHIDQLSHLEKMIRLHHELEVNLEGLDIIVNLLSKIDHLERELQAKENRLRRYDVE